MVEIMTLSIFFEFIYLSIGFGVGMILVYAYDIDILIGCMLLCPIIILIVAIFELCKLIKVLFKN